MAEVRPIDRTATKIKDRLRELERRGVHGWPYPDDEYKPNWLATYEGGHIWEVSVPMHPFFRAAYRDNWILAWEAHERIPTVIHRTTNPSLSW